MEAATRDLGVASPGNIFPSAGVLRWTGAFGYVAVLIGARVLPTGIDDVHRVASAAALVVGAGICAAFGTPWLAVAGLVVSLAITAVDNLAAGLAIGLAFWIWFRGRWAGAPMLAAFSMLLWLRELTRWPDVFADWLTSPLTLLPAVAEAQMAPTASGVWPFAGALLLVVSVRFAGVRIARRVLLVCGAFVAYVVWRAMTLRSVSAGNTPIDLFVPLWIFVAALAGMVALFASARAPQRGPVGLAKSSWRSLVVCAAFAPLAIWLLPSAPTAPRIVFLNEGGMDWHRPRRASMVGVEFGMFGSLPYYLEADGIEVAAMTFEELQATRYDGFDVLVTINNPRVWEDLERERLDKFLRSGGSLLVLGDHTDVFGCKKGFDSLLAPYGMSLRFDSAYYARESWSGSAYVAHHPAFTRGEGPLTIGHGIGASVALAPGAENLITGRYAFSDAGVRQNEMGAYLGNYHYELGERVGDLALAAWTSVGDGRVVVYGDTSAFQSSGLTHSYRSHVLPLMQWLGTRSGVAEAAWYRLLLTLLVLGAAYAATRGRIAFLGGAAGGCLAVVLAGATTHLFAPAAATMSGRILIDESLHPWTGHYDAQMNSIGPLYTNLARTGLSGIAGDQRIDLDDPPRGVVIIAPTRRMEERETERILEYVRGGGSLLVSAGLESRAAVQPLLAAVGLDVGTTPLGVVPPASSSHLAQMEPRTLNAWPLRVHPSVAGDVQELFRYGPHLLALAMRIGAGQLVWISDSQFFSNRNIESSRVAWPGNVMFVENVFAMLFGGDAAEVAERFPSPEKPQ